MAQCRDSPLWKRYQNAAEPGSNNAAPLHFRPMFSPARWLLASGLFLAPGCGGPNHRPPTIDLAPGADPLEAPVSDVTDAVWLGDDRWAIIAPQDRAVDLVDFSQRSITAFGAGKRAYEQPFYLFRAADSVVVDDWQLRRATLWSLDGRMGRAVPAVDALRGALPRARDARGHWYFELMPTAGTDGGGQHDSAAVVRTEPDFSRPDTVARLAPLDMAEMIAEGRRRYERRLLSGQDRWGALPDGSVWIARVGQNRVDWIDPEGQTHRGDALPDKVLPVTEPDREIFLRRFPQELRATAEQIPFVPIKPPFEAAFAAPSGEIWLVKSRAVGDTLRSNQVVGREGTLLREVRHHGHGRLLAAGPRRVLLAEPFEAGIRLYQLALPE